MDESWISVLIMVAFFILPIIFGKGKKREAEKEEKNLWEEIFSEVDIDHMSEDFETQEYNFNRERYVKPNVKIVEKPKMVSEADVAEEDNIVDGNEVKVGTGMSKDEKKKLIIYSEVMSPKYKEY